MKEYETRAGLRVEVRAKDDGGVVVEGYAAIYDEETDIGGVFREVIRPGAFRSAIERGDDVTLNINHNDNFLLARTSSGTLELREDKKGLWVRSELDPSDPDVARLVPKMRRGDLSKMSFAFSVPEGGQNWSTSADGMDVREIKDVMLFDVSVVSTPAYNGTSIALRSKDEAKREAKAAEEAQRQTQAAKMRELYFARRAEQEQKFRRI